MVPCSYTVPCARAGRYHPTEPVVIDVGAALHGNVMFKISSLSLGDPDTGAAAQRNRLRQSRLHVATGRNSCGAPHRTAPRCTAQASSTLCTRRFRRRSTRRLHRRYRATYPREYAEYRLHTRPSVLASTASTAS